MSGHGEAQGDGSTKLDLQVDRVPPSRARDDSGALMRGSALRWLWTGEATHSSREAFDHHAGSTRRGRRISRYLTTGFHGAWFTDQVNLIDPYNQR